MKITRVTPLLADRFLFVEVETDAGLTGTGESGAWGHMEASAAAIAKFGEYLVGQDPGPIEHHWQTMQRFAHFQGAAISGAISAIDIALWDIKGQAAGQPIHALFGGPTRTRARAYAHVKAATAEQMTRLAELRKAQGFTAVGHVNPFLDEDRDVAYFRAHARKIDDAVAVVADLRAALGPDVDLCLEIHRRLTPSEARTFAAEIVPFRPYFCEDPIAPGPAEAMGALAARLPVPLATGERFHAPHQFHSHFLARAMDFARVSVCLVGGITGARKVAAEAEAFGIEVAPHNPLSPVSLAACLHLDAAIPNFAIQEYPVESGPVAADAGAGRLRGADLVDRLPRMVDGFVEVPTGAGLGVGLTEAARVAATVHRPVRMRRHLDGFVVDQ
jgi:galactonate dehydratase